MNILIIHFDNITSLGGGPEVIKALAPKLLLRGNKISIITTTHGIRSNIDIKIYLKSYMIDLDEICVLSPTSIPTLKSKKVIKSKFKEADIVYFFVWMGGLERYILKLQNEMKIPVIAGHHSEIEHGQISLFQLLYFKIFGSRSGRTIKSFAGQHVLNNKDSKTLTDKGFRNIFLIPNGVELDRYKVSKNKYGKFMILFLARLEPEKGVMDIPYLLDLLSSRISEYFEFAICGDGSLKSYIENLNSKYKNISFYGYVSDDKKRDLLSRSHILISLSNSEGFPISILEGIASGTPVVAINNAGLREIIKDGETGYLVGSINDMAERILSLYNLINNNFDSYLEIVKRCRLYASYFRWDNITTQYLEMFNKVIDRFKADLNAN